MKSTKKREERCGTRSVRKKVRKGITKDEQGGETNKKRGA